MIEYGKLGHMELVHKLIGNHAVTKEYSLSIQLRVVFDTSCKIQSGISLNDVLLKETVKQNDIIYTLIRLVRTIMS